MMVHIFTSASFPEGMAATQRIYCYARGWKEAGVQSKVLVCRNYGRVSCNNKEGESRGVSYRYLVSQKKLSSNFFIKQFNWFIGDFLNVIPYIFRNVKKGDISYVYLYNNFCQLLILLFTKIKGAKVVREVCEHPSALGKDTKLDRFFRRFEYKILFPLYNGFVPISQELNKFVFLHKSQSAQSIIVPILVEPKEHEKFSDSDRIYDVPYIIHTGTMQEQKDSISIILKAFAHFKKNDKKQTRLVFTGPQANEKCSYLPLIQELDILDYVDLRGLVSAREVAVLQHFATLSIIYKSENLQTKNCFPTKLGEALMSGVPVITTSVGDAKMYLEDNKSAIILNPGSIDELRKKIELLVSNSELCHQLSQNGRHISEVAFSPKLQGFRMVEWFNTLFK